MKARYEITYDRKNKINGSVTHGLHQVYSAESVSEAKGMFKNQHIESNSQSFKIVACVKK